MVKLLSSYFITTSCSWILSFLIPLYVYNATKSAFWTALMYAVSMAPYILVTPFAGVWSDRYRKRTFLIAGDISNIVIAFAVYIVSNYLTGNTAIIGLVLLGFLIASISAVHHPMFQGIAPELLADNLLARFNSFVNAFDNTIYVAAPIAVAFMMRMVPMHIIVVYCAIGSALSIPILILLKNPDTIPNERHGILHELSEGVRYVLDDENLISFSLLFTCVNLGLSVIGANLLFIFASAFHVAQDQIGYFYGIIGAGAIVGSLVAPKLVKWFDEAQVIVGCCFSAGCIALMATLVKTPLLFSIEWSIATACLSAVVVTFFTFRQRVVPQELLGRTVGVTRLISYLAIPPASLFGGYIMEKLNSEPAVLSIGGAAIILGSLVALRAPAFRRRSTSQYVKT